MARAALGWSRQDLAGHAGVALSTIQRIEEQDGAPPAPTREPAQTFKSRSAERARVLEALMAALVAAGISLLPDRGDGAGVRYKPKG